MGTGGLFLRKLRAGVLDEPTGFVWVEQRKLAGSGYPASRRQLKWLADQGINTILTLTERPLPAEWLNGLGMNVKNIPIGDHQSPAVDTLDASSAFIEQEVNAGRSVVVHCLAGEGRTGCVLAAYLIHSEKIGAREAMARLRKLKPGFVESQQEKSVLDFASKESDSKEPQ